MDVGAGAGAGVLSRLRALRKQSRFCEQGLKARACVHTGEHECACARARVCACA
jgi:hypothetical protein